MRLANSLISFVALAFTVVAAAPTSNTTAAIACPPSRNSIYFRRMWRADLTSHFYSTYGPEVARYGATNNYVEEPPQGRVYPVRYEGTVPLFRCANNQGTPQVDYLYTADPGEWRAQVAGGCQVTPDPPEAGISEGIGYLYTSSYCGSVPLYRLYSASRFDHLYTIDPTERRNNIDSGLYADEGIAGYVLPN